MALKTTKQATPPDQVAQSAATDIATNAIGPGLIEDMIADQLLDSVDWQKVKQALLKKAPARLFAWLAGGDNTPINISQFPELSALPSSEDRAA
jgi:hypothetical protein